MAASSSSSSIPSASPFNEADETAYAELLFRLVAHKTTLEALSPSPEASAYHKEIIVLLEQMEVHKKNYDKEKQEFMKKEFSSPEESRVSADGAISYLKSLNGQANDLSNRVKYFLISQQRFQEINENLEEKIKAERLKEKILKESKAEEKIVRVKKIPEAETFEEQFDLFCEANEIFTESPSVEGVTELLNAFEKLIPFMPVKATRYSAFQLEHLAQKKSEMISKTLSPYEKEELEAIPQRGALTPLEREQIIQFQTAASRIFQLLEIARRCPQVPYKTRVFNLIEKLANLGYAPAMKTVLAMFYAQELQLFNDGDPFGLALIPLVKYNKDLNPKYEQPYLNKYGMMSTFVMLNPISNVEKYYSPSSFVKATPVGGLVNEKSRIQGYMMKYSSSKNMTKAQTHFEIIVKTIIGNLYPSDFVKTPKKYSRCLLNGVAFLPLFCHFYPAHSAAILAKGEALAKSRATASSTSGSESSSSSSSSTHRHKELDSIPHLQRFLDLIPLFNEFTDRNTEGVVEFLRQFSEEEVKMILHFLRPDLRDKVQIARHYEQTGEHPDIPSVAPLASLVGLFVPPADNVTEVANENYLTTLKNNIDIFSGKIVSHCQDYREKFKDLIPKKGQEILEQICASVVTFKESPTDPSNLSRLKELIESLPKKYISKDLSTPHNQLVDLRDRLLDEYLYNFKVEDMVIELREYPALRK